MSARVLMIALLLSGGAACAQMLPFPFVPQTAAATAPGFVGETSKNSLTTNALTTNPTGQTGCAAYSYCIPYPEAALAGNIGIVSFQYDNDSTSTPTTATAADDKSDTYTCLPGAVDSGSGKWNGLCYSPNLTAGAHLVTVTFGTTAVTQVQAELGTFNNISTSSPVDAHTSCAGSSSTTANCGSVTTTAANDLIYVQLCRAGTPLSTSAFQPGSGFTLGTAQYQDGCATEFEVDTGTGSITPSMTLGGASTYIEFITAFKAASAGSAPSGLYVKRLESWGTPEAAAGGFTLQFPSGGNLLYATSVCGTLVPTTLTDSGSNAWGATGSYTNGGASAGNLLEWYAFGAGPNSTNTQTFATTGSSGDCTFTMYDIVNAPASNPFVERHAFTGTPTTTTRMPSTAATYLPNATSDVFFANGGQAYNTSISIAQPSSGCYFDAGFWGGESINGPEPLDQNNIWSHCYFSTLGNLSFQTNLSASTSEANAYVIDLVSFLSPNGIGIVNTANTQATSGSSLAITVPATRAGDLLAIATGFYDGATLRTVSKVCTDGTACAAGNSFTQVPGAAAAGVASTLPGTDQWVLLSAKAGVTTITITYSGAVTNAEAMYWEAEKGNAGTWAIDNSGSGNHIHGTVSSGTATGAAVTTSGAVDFCIANVSESGTGVSANPKSGNAFVYPGDIFSDTGDAAASLLSATAGSQTPAWTSGSGTYNGSTACFD
ncbi:MAG TPA: hypothetical protein VGF96_13365 [Terracidiphilus sp.]|jgi:hypothetical protein